MLPLQWLASARDDLAGIVDYIAERDEGAALRLLDAIGEAVAALPDHPLLYRKGRMAGTREMVVHPHYLVVYRLSSKAIEVVAVLHTSKQFPPWGDGARCPSCKLPTDRAYSFCNKLAPRAARHVPF